MMVSTLMRFHDHNMVSTLMGFHDHNMVRVP